MRYPTVWSRAAHGAPLILALALLALTLAVAESRGSEIVPQLGITRAVSGGGNAQLSTGLALRTNLFPSIKGEIGVSYRSESRFDDQLKERSWPVTASLYLAPIPAIYAGAGVGWYQTTFDYPSGAFPDQTQQQFGVHVGGGVELPLAPAAGLDLNGRYVMMRDQQAHLVPEKFNPDFWTTSLGLAIHF